MKKIISILMAFALALNLFGKSFGNNQKLQKNVDETNIYESYLNKKTQKMNIKVTDTLSKKLVYADSVDLSNVDEEKILKDIQENQETEQENLEILETEDDELNNSEFFHLERHKARRTNAIKMTKIAGIGYRVVNTSKGKVWYIGKKHEDFGYYTEISIPEKDETVNDLNKYVTKVEEILRIEKRIREIGGTALIISLATITVKLAFLLAVNTTAALIAVGIIVLTQATDAYVMYGQIDVIKNESMIYYQLLEYWKEINENYPTTPGIAYEGKGF